MQVAEPPNTYGLWARVKERSGWPQSNEDTLRMLSADWRTGSSAFATAASHQLADVRASWGDAPGQLLAARAESTLRSALTSANGMSRLAGMTAGFADTVSAVKTDIRNLIETNLEPFAAIRSLPPGVAAAAQENVVNQLAAEVNRIVAAAAGGVSQNGWPVDPPRRLRTVPGTNTQVIVADGPAGEVLLHVLSQIDKRVEDIDLLSAKGEKDDWGYANRPIRGSSAVSNHASATAVDINATRHPLGARGTFTPAQVTEIHRILAEVDNTVRWGGDYTGRKDEMHFEINAPQPKVAEVARRLTSGG